MKPIKLSARLQTIANMIQPGSIVADIGTDHALLPVYLVKQGIISKAYACDVSQGPLNRAIAFIDTQAVNDSISTILCNGLVDVPKDADTIVIAGMGLDTITMILEASLNRLPYFKHILIQSNSKLEMLRTWVRDHHYAISEERLVEDGHFYTVININPQICETISDDDILFGKQLDDSAAFLAYWQQRYTTLQGILLNMPKDHPKYDEYTLLSRRIYDRISKKHVD